MSRLQLVALVVLALVAEQVRAAPITAKSPDGKQVASANGKKIEIKDAQTDKALRSIVAHTADVTALAYAPDGKTLASADKEGAVKLLDVATGRAFLALKANPGVSKLKFSANGRKLEVKAPNGTRTFELETGKEVK